MAQERLLTQEEVQAKLEQFQEYLALEQEIQQQLVSLRIHGTRDQVAAAQERHDALIADVEQLRTDKMLPILEELSVFVSICQELEESEDDKA